MAPWPVTHQAPLPMEYFRQEYWRGMQSPSLGDLPDPRDEPGSLASPALADGFFTTEPPGELALRMYSYFSVYSVLIITPEN